MDRFEHRLIVMKNNGVNISNLLDIGAYRGEFTQMVHRVWSNVRSWQVEADERQAPYLQSDAIFGLLSSRPNQEVDFYTLGMNSITTGSSIFKELTPHYNPNSTVVIKKTMTTIDSLNRRYNFYGNWKDLGLIKIDTQGSESNDVSKFNVIDPVGGTYIGNVRVTTFSLYEEIPELAAKPTAVTFVILLPAKAPKCVVFAIRVPLI